MRQTRERHDKIMDVSDAHFSVLLDLPGWTLVWAELTVDPASPAAHAVLRETIEKARARHGAQLSADDPTVAAIRKLFRAAGCDPTRYRPSSEALLRRVLKSEDLAAIQPLVDLNNALSIDLAVPSCIMAADSMEPPLVLRAGAPGETFESLRGPFSLEGKPLLADAKGPLGTPITDSVRVKIQSDTAHGWLVAYLPKDAVFAGEAERTLRDLAARAGVEVGRVFAV
ncbi:MAG: phenylalanine--tRNA ligase beta subunit-related protein [Acidobacteriota bacterium]